MTATYEEQMAGTSLEQKNAALRAAVEKRLFEKNINDDEHPVLADQDDVEDEPDPLAWNDDDEYLKEMAVVLKRLHRRHPTSMKFKALLDEVWQMHVSKSKDYGSEIDPLANIRHGAEFVDIDPWRGCMVRIADKVQRLRTYCRTGKLVHEGVRDTLLDLANYSLLALLLYEEEHEQPACTPDCE